jgi:tetratricopeptide (TPR) repeat protein
MTLAKLQIPEPDIIKAIEKDQTVFDLKIQDILELKKAGVPDGVIKLMLDSKNRWGKGGAPVAAPGAAPAAAPGAAPAAAAPVVKEKTPEEIRAEEERQREEARRLAEEQKKAEEARRSAYARGVLKRGLSLAEDGKWVDSVEVFQRFVVEGNFAPGTIEFYNAKYGMAKAMANAHLYQSAAKLLVEVLLDGPERPFFKEAFVELRALRKEIIYNPPDLEQLTKFSLVSYSQSFQDEFNYVLGEFFYDYGNYQRALKHFDAVADGAPDKARALYLTGLVQVRYKMFKSAVETFQRSINEAETAAEPDTAVVDLAYMALARIAYEAGNHDAAIFYYRKVPRDSVRAPVVFYEMAWTYLMKGDYSRALGAFHALHSPYFKRTFYPELWILEARTYGDLCRYDQAKKALEMFDNQIAIYIDPLKRYVNAQKSPDDFYVNFLASMNGAAAGETFQNPLPREISYPILSNVEFYNVYQTIRQIEKENAEIQKNTQRLGAFAAEMLVKLAVLRKDRVFEAGVKIQQILKELDGSMGDAQVRETEIEVDINAAAIEKMTEETRRLVGEGGEESGEVQKSRGGAIVGGDTQVWPFQGEYWADEVPYYRSMLTSQCLQ